jgi:hypothetical protein
MSAPNKSHLDVEIIHEVTKSLIALTSKASSSAPGKKADLFDADGKKAPIFAQIQLVGDVARKVARPVRVKIPHGLFFPDEFEHSICIFCRSADKEAIENFLGNHKSIHIAKVVSLDEVKKVYKRFEDKKTLLKDFSHFICDARIMSHLYNLLGKVFAQNNHYPIPIDIESIDGKLIAAINKVTHDSTYMFIKGNTINIRLGYTFMPVKDVTNNIYSGLEFAVPKLKEEWKSVHSIHLKTSTSPATPIYAKTKSAALEFVKSKIEEAKKKNSSSTSSSSSNNTNSSAKKAPSTKNTAAPVPATPVATISETRSSARKGKEAVAEKTSVSKIVTKTPAKTPSKTPTKTPAKSQEVEKSSSKPEKATPAASAKKSAKK